MNDSDTTRRRFLVAAVTFSGLSTMPALLKSTAAWAQSGEKMNAAMVSMARLLVPHDGVSDSVYAEILDQALSATAADNSFARALAEAEAALNAGGEFKAMDAGEQLAALNSIEGSGAFNRILAQVKDRMYDHPAVWGVIGYEGPSWQQGGYLNRGAGEIDWLPEVE